MTGIDPTDVWRHLAWICAEHVRALQTDGMIGEDVAAVVVQTIESAGGGIPVDGSLQEIAVAFDDRVDGLSSAAVVGVARMGRGTAEVVATVGRLILRERLLELVRAAIEFNLGLLEMAGAHVVTMLPMHQGGQPVQPTTFAHYLGGVIGPVDRAVFRLFGVLEVVDECPMGAVAGSSSRFAPDRQAMAAALGFRRTVANTFDAVAAVDWLKAAAQGSGALLDPVERLVRELQAWIRSTPEAFMISEDQTGRSPDLPQLRQPRFMDDLLDVAMEARSAFAAVDDWCDQAGYGPQVRLDRPLGLMLEGISAVMRAMADLAALLRESLEINRAALGNRAGKSFVTSSDLIDFLILEEHIAPGDARIIVSRALAIARERGLEITGIDREIIDAAGLLIIGREIGIEIETLGRYVAPRRFLEQRSAAGAPSPQSIREWIAAERELVTRRESQATSLAEIWSIAPSHSLS